MIRSLVRFGVNLSDLSGKLCGSLKKKTHFFCNQKLENCKLACFVPKNKKWTLQFEMRMYMLEFIEFIFLYFFRF